MAKQKSVRNIPIAARSQRYHAFNNTKRAGSTAAQADPNLPEVMRRSREAELGTVKPIPMAESMKRLTEQALKRAAPAFKAMTNTLRSKLKS